MHIPLTILNPLSHVFTQIVQPLPHRPYVGIQVKQEVGDVGKQVPHGDKQVEH